MTRQPKGPLNVTLGLYKLEHFIAVCDEGSFTRAADRLHLSQQALSSSVRALEREVGAPLLDRSGGKVSPRPAGDSLLTDARVLSGLAHSALQRAIRVDAGDKDVLRIGHTPAVTVDEVTELIYTARESGVSVETEVNQRDPADLTEQLVYGEIDIGLCRAMSPTGGISRDVVTWQPLRIAVPSDHPLASAEKLTLPDLRDEYIMVWGTPGNSGYTDFLVQQCRSAGFEPHIFRNPVQGTPPISAVVGTGHIAFVTGRTGPAAGGRARVIELDQAARVPLGALTARHLENPSRDAFLRAATNTQLD